MNQASQATANAICLEVKKDGLQQRQSGDWSLRFTVAGVEIDHRLVRAAMGARYQCVLVEVNDDEEPVDHQAIDRDKWRDLGPVKQAGIRCKDPVFFAYLTEEHTTRMDPITNEHEAAVFIRGVCGVASRKDFALPGNHRARTLWHQIDNAFQAWRAKENA